MAFWISVGVRNSSVCTSFLVLEDANGGQKRGFGTRRRRNKSGDLPARVYLGRVLLAVMNTCLYLSWKATEALTLSGVRIVQSGIVIESNLVKLRGYSLIAVRRDSWKVIYKSKGRYPDEGGRGDSSFSRFELRTITSLELTQQTYREAFVFAVVHAEPRHVRVGFSQCLHGTSCT